MYIIPFPDILKMLHVITPHFEAPFYCYKQHMPSSGCTSPWRWR